MPGVLLLTGGLGFVGSNFVSQFHESFNQIIVFDDYSVKEPRKLSFPNVSYIRGDITNEADFKLLPNRVDYCIHLAAKISVAESMAQPELYFHVNVDGSVNVFKWCAQHGCRALVAASSAAVYGETGATALTEDMAKAPGGISPYAQSKFAMEQSARVLFPTQGAANGMRINFIRPFNIYGPHQSASGYAGFITTALRDGTEKKSITIFGDGHQTRDFIFVEDVCRAFFTVLTEPENDHSGKPVQHLESLNCGCARDTTIKEVAESIVEALGNGTKLDYKPARAGDPLNSLSSISRITEATSWTPKTSLRDGLLATTRWYVESHNK